MLLDEVKSQITHRRPTIDSLILQLRAVLRELDLLSHYLAPHEPGYHLRSHPVPSIVYNRFEVLSRGIRTSFIALGAKSIPADFVTHFYEKMPRTIEGDLFYYSTGQFRFIEEHRQACIEQIKDTIEFLESLKRWKVVKDA